MNHAIGDVLPLAIAVAISPLPIIAAILMLLSPRARANSLSFLAGWAGAILLAVVAFQLLSGLVPRGDGDGHAPVVGTVKIVIGVLLLLVAARQWRRRPRDGTPPPMPMWMSAIDSMTAPKAARLGLILAVVNPKNLMMELSAGLSLGTAELTAIGSVISVVIFTVLAASTVTLPVVANLAAGEGIRPTLLQAREWLIPNNAIILTVLTLVLGVANIGAGIGRL